MIPAITHSRRKELGETGRAEIFDRVTAVGLYPTVFESVFDVTALTVIEASTWA